MSTRVAFFGIADSPAYLPMLLTALGSVSRFHKECDFYVLGKFRQDAAALELIEQKGAQFEYIDLSSTFLPCLSISKQTGNWPSECFWWSKAYEIFLERGYTHCCLLDGDILCRMPLELEDILPCDEHFAAVGKRNEGRFNSGVLFFNNQKLQSVGLFEKIKHIYRNHKTCNHSICSGWCREVGDQALLKVLVEQEGITVRRLANAYNHMVLPNEQKYRAKNSELPISESDTYIFHLLRKPWHGPAAGAISTYQGAYRSWWKFSASFWGDEATREYFGNRA